MNEEIVLGLGGCLDYEISWDPAVLADLVERYGISAAELSTSLEVSSERDLVRSVLGFVRDGVGGERSVASSDIVEAFAARFPRRTTLGGTNVRAALAMSRLGVRSTLHLVSIDDQVRQMLPDEVSYVCSATRDTVDPHLIVQFPAGSRVRAGDVDIEAPHANRLIYVNDPPNRELGISPELGSVLRSAAVFLVSGFNSMQDAGTLRTRLDELREHMRSLPAWAQVVYEDAGFHVPGMSDLVRERLLDLVDVYGMNEDELQAYVGRRVDLLDADAVAVASAQLRDVVPARTVVVHTKYWSLALGEGAEAYRDALDRGIVMASTRYVHGDAFTIADYEQVARLPRHGGGAAFARQLERRLPGQACCVPAVILETPTPTTIGLGDSFVGGFIAALARTRQGAGRGVA
ncbi:ADP-dependent glucokinase/phosphofructokinase [Georgenia sp. AZ-5]|uniref:ADP-dependent glucokinase/phosphofructokinase n=1 Tax=Georgenia sp. AZ-5 TaxID=3367526 RepID=UPI0037544168